MGVVVVLAAAACASSVTTSTAPSLSPSVVTTGSSASTAPGTTVALAVAKPSPGCGTSTTKAVDNDKRIVDVGGTERWYLLTTPTVHDGKKPLPVVVDFHGLAEGADVHTAMSGFATAGKKDGFVVVVPNGTGSPVHWDANTKSDPNQDVIFIDKMLDSLGAELCIDTTRVYATGLSYGAIMSSFLTCVRANRFAAVAPVAGLQVPPADCQPSRPMPVVTFHGTADPILLFNGGVNISVLAPKPAGGGSETEVAAGPPADLNGPGYPANVAAWAARNGCQPEAKDTPVTPEIVQRVYDCPANAAVEFYIIVGGGHAWPGSEFSKSIANVVGPTTMDINATDLIWQFFQRFHL